MSSCLMRGMMGPNRKDVIVLGAGISGLSCAKLLSEKYGLDVLVLEARDRVGGRTHTLRDPAFKNTDLGGAYVGPTQRRVARMAEELGLEFYKINIEDKSIMDLEGIRILYYGTIPPILNPMVALDLNHAQRLVDRMAKEIPIEAPWSAPRAKEWDKVTFQDFIDKTCWTSVTKVVMALTCQTVLVTEPCEVSLLYFLWYMASGQGVQRMVNVINGAQERKFVGGSMQLSERMAEKVGHDVIKFSHPVVKVQQVQGQDSYVKVTCANGEHYESGHVVTSLPFATLGAVNFEPPLPPLKAELIQRLPMGHAIKCMMFYETAFWRKKGLCGQMACSFGPVRYCLDDTKPDGSCPCIMGFIQSSVTRQMLSLSTEERKMIVAKHYADVFKCDEFLKPVNYVEMNWMGEEYSDGCLSYMPPGLMTTLGKEIREPFDRVHFAGTETAIRWAGYMDGAIEAGERAAREILHSMGKIPASEIWQDEAPSAQFPEYDFPGRTVEALLPTVRGFLWTLGSVAVAGAAWVAHRYLDINLEINWK